MNVDVTSKNDAEMKVVDYADLPPWDKKSREACRRLRDLSLWRTTEKAFCSSAISPFSVCLRFSKQDAVSQKEKRLTFSKNPNPD